MTQKERQVLQLIEADPMLGPQEIAGRLGISAAEAEKCIESLTEKGSIAGKGYVLRTESYATVVGGINVDIGGRPFEELVAADSNPGIVSTSLGGVGRNIAHNMSLMGLDVRFLSAYGDDLNGERVAASCSELGIDISRALRVPGGTTSTYLYITDRGGEMALAVSDMEICKKITPEYLEKNLDLLQNAQVVAADANIPEESLAFLAKKLSVPLFVDPVSTAKAEKIRPILSKIHTLKPNRLEAEYLTGISIETKADAEKAAFALLEKGVRRVFLSLGAEGVFAATAKESLWHGIIPGKTVNTTGCGDSFTAALVWAYLEGFGLKDTAGAGLAAASITTETNRTINPLMSAALIRERMQMA